jgi:transporter family-2 protein
MNWYVLIPLAVGAMTVLQGTLNREMSASMGLGSAIFLNSVIVVALGSAFYAVVRLAPGALPPIFAGAPDVSRLALWMVVPGIFGFCIIAGIPWAISRLGAARVFVVIVAAQLVVSLLWDAFVSGESVTLARGGGALLALAGVALATWEA